MWAQLVKVKTRSGNSDKIEELGRKWEEQVGRGTDSGWVRTLTYRNRSNPNEVFMLAEFESEDKARKNERGERHNALMQEMAQLFDGPPEYVDLEPTAEQKR